MWFPSSTADRHSTGKVFPGGCDNRRTYLCTGGQIAAVLLLGARPGKSLSTHMPKRFRAESSGLSHASVARITPRACARRFRCRLIHCQRGEVVAAFPGDGGRGGVLDGRSSPSG